jgi:hypothetical protein
MQATMLNELEATQEELWTAFESASQFYLHLNGPEFLDRFDNGQLDLSDGRVQKVMRRLDYVRPHYALKQAV